MILTLDEVKKHLRIEHDEDDSYLKSLILQAQTTAEDYTRLKFADVPEPETPEETSDEAQDDAPAPEATGDTQQETSSEERVPAAEPVRIACLLMISYIYENRDVPDSASYNAMRRAFNNLLYPYRDPGKMF